MTDIVLEPLDLIARHAALVPPPRVHLTRYQLVAPGLIDTQRDAPEPEHRKTHAALVGRRGRHEAASGAGTVLRGRWL